MAAYSVTELTAIARDHSESDSDRFTALYAALQILNRQDRGDDYADLVREFESEFGGKPYFHSFRAVVAYGDGTSASSVREAIRHAQRALHALNDRPGVLHQYASFCASLATLNGEIAPEELRSAQEAVDKAMALSSLPNPNFNYTRARLLRAAGRIDDALVEIGTAIHRQDAASDGGVRRLTRFEAFRSTLLFERETRKILARLEDTKKDLDRARSEQVQLLGILAAVIALITSSVGVAANWEPIAGLSVFLGIAGGITIAFSALAWSLGGSRLIRLVPALIVGIGLAAWAVWRVGS